MAYETKPNTGASFPNKKTSENSPNLTGTIKLSDDLIEQAKSGKQINIASWKNVSQNGKPYYSHRLSIKVDPIEQNNVDSSLELDSDPF